MKNKYKIVGEHVMIFINRRKSSNLFTVIDLEDLELVSSIEGTWCAVKNHSGSFYIMSYENGYLHRHIMNPPKGLVVDHINHNTLDNRRGNLRSVTNRENLLNYRPDRYENTKRMGRKPSQGKKVYVTWHKSNRKWQARARVDGKRKFVGYYHSEKEAENAALNYLNELS